MRLAVAAYRPEWLSPEAAAAKRADWVAQAAGQGASLLVFPEYAGVERALAQGVRPQTVAQTCQLAAEHADEDARAFKALARRHSVWIVAGSAPLAVGGAQMNRALVFGPGGEEGYQDKLILTPWERANTPLSPGQGIRLIDLPWGRVAVVICYDSEFPLLVRSATQAGASLIVIPACTDAPQGATRVRNAARARALEGACITAVAPLVGTVPDCPLTDENTGRAGVYAPPDAGFPGDGILAEGPADTPGWVYADLPDPSQLTPRDVNLPDHWTESETKSETVTVPRFGQEIP